MPNVTSVRATLRQAGDAASKWFFNGTTPLDRSVYFERGKLGDDGSGAVYAYFDERADALYVGQTGRKIKERQHDETSPHKDTEWWDHWRTVRFLQMENETDRLTLELMLILSLQPIYNASPGRREWDAMFAAIEVVTTSG